MEKNKENQNTKRNNKLFIFGAIALIVLLFVISIAEIISINSMNNKIKNQQKDITTLTNELNYYKDKSNNTNNGDFYEGVVD